MKLLNCKAYRVLSFCPDSYKSQKQIICLFYSGKHTGFRIIPKGQKGQRTECSESFVQQSWMEEYQIGRQPDRADKWRILI